VEGCGIREWLHDRLVDVIVAWDSEARIRERIGAHFKAGATHVGIQAIRVDGESAPMFAPLKLWHRRPSRLKGGLL
jgi:hypothetical protein